MFLKICMFCKYPFVNPIITNERKNVGGIANFFEAECKMCCAKYQIGIMILNGPTRVVDDNIPKG